MRISDWSQTCALPIWHVPASARHESGRRLRLRRPGHGTEHDGRRCGRRHRRLYSEAPACLEGQVISDMPAGPLGKAGGGALKCRFTPVCPIDGTKPRSEEHTSELQSLMRISYAVFCLKKKITHNK